MAGLCEEPFDVDSLVTMWRKYWRGLPDASLTVQIKRPRAGYLGALHSEGWRREGTRRQGCCLCCIDISNFRPACPVISATILKLFLVVWSSEGGTQFPVPKFGPDSVMLTNGRK